MFVLLIVLALSQSVMDIGLMHVVHCVVCIIGGSLVVALPLVMVIAVDNISKWPCVFIKASDCSCLLESSGCSQKQFHFIDVKLSD